MITSYGEMTDLHGFKIPAWLPNGAADSSSVGLLGMVAYYRANPNPTTADLIAKIADGVAAYQLGNYQAYPFAMHPVTANAHGYWHDRGAYQGQALVEAGMANSNTREQFVRGVGQWKGPNIDSPSVQFSWDDSNLYLAVNGRAPQHQQDYSLNNVWHGEATWVYFASDLNKSRLSSNFALAQTSDGSQILDWLNSGFLKNAHMVWSKTDNGFIYEASVSWFSIRLLHPQVGMKIELEVGRCIGGNSFMDLTGPDPDVISNLLPVVTLVDSYTTSNEASGEQEPVFLSVQIGDEKPMLVPTNVSPDSEYWWLDRVTRFPIRLIKGEYPLRYAYAGTGKDGLSKVDAFYVQPTQPQRVFKLPDGQLFSLTYDTITGKITYEESS